MDARDLVLCCTIPLRHPDSEFVEVDVGVVEHLVRCAIRHDHGVSEVRAGDLALLAAVADLPGVVGALETEHHHTVDHVDPPVGAVLHKHHRRMRLPEHVIHRADHLHHAIGIEIGCWFVEQQHLRAHGECTGEGEPLHLAARQVHDRTVELYTGQTNGIEGLIYTLPCEITRHVEILRPEHHVIPQSLEDRLCIRILQHQPDLAARGMHLDATNSDGPLGDAAVGVLHCNRRLSLRRIVHSGCVGLPGLVTEQTGSPLENGGFAYAGSSKEQHMLTGMNLEIQAAHREMLARGMTVAPMVELQGDARRGFHAGGFHSGHNVLSGIPQSCGAELNAWRRARHGPMRTGRALRFWRCQDTGTT